MERDRTIGATTVAGYNAAKIRVVMTLLARVTIPFFAFCLLYSSFFLQGVHHASPSVVLAADLALLAIASHMLLAFVLFPLLIALGSFLAAGRLLALGGADGLLRWMRIARAVQRSLEGTGAGLVLAARRALRRYRSEVWALVDQLLEALVIAPAAPPPHLGNATQHGSQFFGRPAA